MQVIPTLLSPRTRRSSQPSSRPSYACRRRQLLFRHHVATHIPSDDMKLLQKPTYEKVSDTASSVRSWRALGQIRKSTDSTPQRARCRLQVSAPLCGKATAIPIPLSVLAPLTAGRPCQLPAHQRCLALHVRTGMAWLRGGDEAGCVACESYSVESLCAAEVGGELEGGRYRGDRLLRTPSTRMQRQHRERGAEELVQWQR